LGKIPRKSFKVTIYLKDPEIRLEALISWFRDKYALIESQRLREETKFIIPISTSKDTGGCYSSRLSNNSKNKSFDKILANFENIEIIVDVNQLPSSERSEILQNVIDCSCVASKKYLKL
jgi:hypothetical protein